MYWRQTAQQFRESKGEKNRKSMKKLVKNSVVPGVIGYIDGVPAGWAAIAPRVETPRIAGSRVMAPVDGLEGWFIPCLFVDRKYRNQGMSTMMIEAACQYAFSQGAPLVEACPNDLPKGERQPAPFVYLGLASAFRKAGFKEVARRSAKRPLMRKLP
jgi:GNAT superfamily N-acetyltransferase